MEVEGLRLALSVPPYFSLRKAVCSYGFFMMAPNSWSDSCGLLHRPLRLLDGRVALTRISQAENTLGVCVFGVQQLSDPDKDHILVQVSRMLRLSEMETAAIAAFHALHAQAKQDGFGRLFRSPSLFEDMIKSLLLCNCGWGRTLSMARALCALQAELHGLPLGISNTASEEVNDVPCPKTPEAKEGKRKHSLKRGRGAGVCKALKFDVTEKKERLLSVNDEGDAEESSVGASSIGLKTFKSAISATASYSVCGAFPTPEELCGLKEDFLAKRCGVGYRATHILKLARDICNGVVDLTWFETPKAGLLPSLDEARFKLLELKGFGPFTCANVLMCMGEYGVIPVDTETVRHLKQVHGLSSCTSTTVSKDVAKVYAHYAPYQFLSYWFELWGCYEKKFGKLSCMDPKSYGRITGPNMRKV